MGLLAKYVRLVLKLQLVTEYIQATVLVCGTSGDK